MAVVEALKRYATARSAGIRRGLPPAWVLVLGFGVLVAALRITVPIGIDWKAAQLVPAVVAIVATLIASRRFSPDRRLPWLLFAVAQAAFMIHVFPQALGGTPPWGPRAGPFLAIGYGAAAVGFVLLWRGFGGKDVDAWLDSLLLGMAVGLAYWDVFVTPTLTSHALDLPTLADVVIDMALLAAIARLIVRRSVPRAVVGLCSLVMLLIATDVPMALQLGATLDAARLLGYVAMGALALHPGAVAIGAPSPLPDEPFTTSRASLLGVAVVIGLPPLVLAHALLGGQHFGDELTIGAALATTLVAFIRLYRLIRTLEDDIRLRHIAEAAAVASTERLAAVQAVVPVGILTTDAAGRITYANRRLTEIAGREVRAAEGLSILDLVHPDDRERLLATSIEAFATRREWSIEIRLSLPTGEARWAALRLRPAGDRASGGSDWVGSVTDITPIMAAAEAEERLARSIRETQKLEALGSLAGGIAHDVNNLLVAILGHIGLARQALAPGTAIEEDLAEAEAAAERVAVLARQMLAFSGGASFQARRVAIGEMVTAMTGLLERSIESHARLALEIQPGLIVTADHAQLEQVVLNLVLNASDALGGASGTIALSVRRFQLDPSDPQLVPRMAFEAGSCALIEVSDNGSGMDEATARRMFEPFFSTRAPGRGLGLAATLGIVRGHGGAIRVSTVPGEGSVIGICLPLADAGVESPRLPAVAPSAADAIVPRPASNAAARRVLVVDDEQSVRQLARRVLERAGFSVDEAGDGPEALAAIESAPGAYAGVLLDLTLPSMDGVAVLDRIREIDPGLTVVLTSGWAQDEVIDRLGGRPGLAFLQKPYAAGELKAAFTR
jgi:PAS domain S-box-containing protein